MVKIRKYAPFYFLNIRGIYPRVKSFVESSPLDKMLFNTVFVTCAHNFVYLKLCFGGCCNIDKLEIVKLSFDRAIL